MNERDRNKIAVGMVAACAIGLLLYGAKAKADGIEVIGPSWHSVRALNSGVVFNNATYGLAYRHTISRDWSFTAGAYKNSYRKASVFTEFDFLPLHLGKASLGIGAGLVTGYQTYDGGGQLKTMAGLVGEYQFTQRVGMVMRVMPLDVVAYGNKPERFGAVFNLALTVRIE